MFVPVYGTTFLVRGFRRRFMVCRGHKWKSAKVIGVT